MTETTQLLVSDLTQVELLCRDADCSGVLAVGLRTDRKSLKRTPLECPKCGNLLATSGEQTRIQAFAEVLSGLATNTIGRSTLRVSTT